MICRISSIETDSMSSKRSKEVSQSRTRHAITTTALAVAMVFALTATPPGSAALAEALMPARLGKATFRKCDGGNRTTCVVDGDTLWIDGVKIRVADIDTPEVSEPKCASELALGRRATSRLIDLLNQGPFELHAWQGRDEDRYGRKLRVLIRNGKSIGDMLVSEGLARTWVGQRQPWC